MPADQSGNERGLLRRAVHRGSVDDVRNLLEAGVDPNAVVGPRSLLALAAADGKADIVELLVVAGADVAWVSDAGWSAATYADADFPEIADRLVELGTPHESRLAHGYTELHRAARRGDVAAVVADAGRQEVDALDSLGDTPLTHAILRRRDEAAAALLGCGANPNHVQGDWSLLTEAAYQDARPDEPTRLVSLLLAAGADPNPAGYPPTFAAVNQEWCSGTVLRQLVTAGADIGCVGGWERQTVLHRIAEIAEADLVDVAVDLGADIEARDASGRTPLLAAAHSANPETFIRLAERGADATARDRDGLSAEELLDESEEAGEIRVYLAARNSN